MFDISGCASTNWRKLDLATSDLLLKIIRVVLLERTLLWKSSKGGRLLVEIRALLTVLLKVNDDERTGRDTKQKIQTLLCEIALNSELFICFGKDAFQSWIITLPRVLCQPKISVQLMNTLLMMGTHRNEMFLDSLRATQEKVLGN